MSHRDILDIAAPSPACGNVAGAVLPPAPPEDPAPHWNDVDVVAASFCDADWRALSEDAKRSYRLAAMEAIRALEARRSASNEAARPDPAVAASDDAVLSGPAGPAPARPAQAARAALVAAAVTLGAGAVLYPAAAPFLSWLPDAVTRLRGPDRQAATVQGYQRSPVAASAEDPHVRAHISSR